MDGLLALEVWDLIVSVLGNVSHVSDRSGKPENDENTTNLTRKSMRWKTLILFFQMSNPRQEALLLFEDNEAVIKMIMKGRSPTMRHVSRTHRVALDCLFDRINLDPRIQIEYIDTKNQLADILTKGNFTRDERNHFWCLFNISHFSSTVCSETISTRFRRRTSHSKNSVNDESYCKGAIAHIILDFSKPGVRSGNQDPWSTIDEKEEGSET